MVRINVRLFATLRQYAPDSLGPGEPMSLNVSPGTTADDVIAQLELPVDEVKRVFVNYRAVPWDYVLQDGDRVSIFPLVAGG